MYFLQHLLFPGRLVSAEAEQEAKRTEDCITCVEDLKEEQKERLKQLPVDVQQVFSLFESLPLLSTPDAFSPSFPVGRLPESIRKPEAYTSAVYQLLKAIDPVIAQRWHWRDIRKVSRSLQVFMQTGRMHSAIMEEQAQAPQESQSVLLPWYD